MRTDASQLVSWAPGMTNPRWLGRIGHVANLKYSFTCPGGASALTALLQVEADFRTDALNPGRIVQVFRGSAVVWEGKMDEATPSADGWTISAHGAGSYGNDFAAYYTTWNANDAVNQAIARGMRWTNPGISESQAFLGQQEDPASQQITDHMNLICTSGGQSWYVTTTQYGNILSVAPLPTVPTRMIIATTPVSRTIAADYNTLWTRYQLTADPTSQTSGSSTAAATYGTAESTVPASIAAHQPMEGYYDLSSAGVVGSAAAIAAGNNVLAQYIRANFAGPFTVSYGQYLTMGGYPVDLGAENGMAVAQLVLTDYGYGGEVVPGPISFLVGEFEYDDTAQTASITPFQNVDSDLSSLLSAIYPSVSTSTS
jgi:hypothetical protein